MENIVTAKKKKTLIIIIAAAVALCVLLFLIVSIVSGSSARRLAEQLELGQKYLNELDYEQAVIAFEAALQIDPKNEEAYLGLAESYVGMGDYARAAEVLEEGYAQTGSERIEQRLEEVKGLLAEGTSGDEDSGNGRTPDEVETQAQMPEDHVMDWKDGNLEAAMREITGIAEGDIMLSDVWEMKELDLNGRGISDITALAEMTNLTRLNLGAKYIPDPGIEETNQISDISSLSGLVKLTVLDLHSNQITDLFPLKSLVNLTDLVLGDNQINDISSLSSLTNLSYLWLGENPIGDFSPLASLTNLTRLGLRDNQISDVSVLSSLTNLTELYLGENQISDISPLAPLTNLTYLELYDNQISDITVLSGLTNLTELYLWGNPVSDYAPVSFVEYLY